MEQVVVFVDEIDSTLSLDFTDDFFAAIRYFYVTRAQQPEFNRLSFVLIGVANPSDLVQDKNRTPFNVGREMLLEGFQLQEAYPLMAGFADKVDRPQEVLSYVLAWTGGQPFLTQKLCQLILQAPFRITAGREATLIEQLVRSRILENWEAQDQPEHLRTIRDRLLQGGEQRAGRRLGLCQQIAQQGEIIADESPEQTELRLTGLVVKQQGKLRIYNRIYAEVFNLAWFDQELGKLRPYGNELTAWIASSRRDESRLLRGQTLQEALAWTSGKSLIDEDYRFLNASQEVEKRVVEEENRILEEARLKAETKTKKATRRLVWSSLIAIALIGFALFGFVTAQHQASIAQEKAIAYQHQAENYRHQADKSQQEVFASQQDAAKAENDQDNAKKDAAKAKNDRDNARKDAAKAKRDRDDAQEKANAAARQRDAAEQATQLANRQKAEALEQLRYANQQTKIAERERAEIQQGTKLEQDGEAALRQFKSQEIEALLLAIRSGKNLQNLTQQGDRPLKEYPATSPILALQTILDNIHEQIQFRGHENVRGCLESSKVYQ